MLLQGMIPALITPFKDDEIDEEGLRKNIRFQLENGASGLLALGTTGEIPTLDADEKNAVLDVVFNEAKGKVPIIVNTGTNSTRATIKETMIAEKKGADYALVVVPYYNKPTQDGIYSHYEVVAKNTSLPIIIYHHPFRTGVKISLETFKKLSQIPNIVAVKDSSSDLHLASHLANMFTLLSGDDALTLPMLSIGAKGCISVIGNLLPKKMSDLIASASNGDFITALRYHTDLLDFFDAMNIESNPIPIKKAMSLLSMPSGKGRMPLSEMTDKNAILLKTLLKKRNLI